MTKGRVLEVTKRHIDKMNKDVFDVNVESEGKTTKYQCWQNLTDKQGKEIEFTVKPAPEGTTFLPTLEMPKGDGSSGFKKPFAPRPAADPKTMIMAYAKDLIVAMLANSKKDHTPVGIANATVAIYRILEKEIEGVNTVSSGQVAGKIIAESVANYYGGKVVDEQDIPFN